MENAEQITQAIQSQLLGLEIWETKKLTLHHTNYEQFGDRQVGNHGILCRVEALVTRIERRQLPGLENHTLTTIVRGFEKTIPGAETLTDTPLSRIGPGCSLTGQAQHERFRHHTHHHCKATTKGGESSLDGILLW